MINFCHCLALICYKEYDRKEANTYEIIEYHLSLIHIWVSMYANANLIKTDFFEARSSAYAKSSALVDDL